MEKAKKLMLKEGYIVVYEEDYFEQDFVILKFFSEFDFGKNSKIMRKYLSEVSRRAYYKDGSKRWFWKILWMYEVRIPKSELKILPDESYFSYIFYNMNNLEIIHNTSGMTSPDGSLNFQGKTINHCKSIKKREFKKILEVALENEETIYESSTTEYFNGSYGEIMFISKYAPKETNFYKPRYNYTRFLYTENSLVNAVLSAGFWKAEETLNEYKTSNPELFKRYNGKEILEDVVKWKNKDTDNMKTIPFEIKEALEKIVSYKKAH